MKAKNLEGRLDGEEYAKASKLKGIIGFAVILVGIILISFGFYLIACCSVCLSYPCSIWYSLNRAGMSAVLLFFGVICLSGGLYLVVKSRRKKKEKFEKLKRNN